VGAFVIAFAQRPGKVFADSRVELTANPGLFLDRISSIWSPTTDLGHIQSGQFVGYLFPQGAWFALAQAIGLPMWVAERLFMGTLLALAAWGVVLLMDDLFDRERGLAHIVAPLLFVANPYVAIFASRATVNLLAYVAMPWLMVAVCRGLRAPRRWHWPAIFAVAVAAAGGGVNAAFLPWVIGAPALLVVYETVVLARRGRDALSFAWRTAVCTAVACAWWIVPVALQSRYGPNFLAFLEQPATIWSTTSMSESLRLLGYWILYFATSYQGSPEPSVSVAAPYLFSPAIIIATFAVPVLAALGLVWNRGWRYAPYFGLLAVGGLLVMASGFPLDKPLERLMADVYYNVSSLQFLRTTYKAAPDVALGFACLSAAACASLYRSARAGMLRVRRFRVPAWGMLLVLLIPIGTALPFFNGTAIDQRLVYKIPSYWRTALTDADRTTPGDHRLMVLPGQVFSWYRWGETVGSIAPALTHRPVLVREATPYADPHAAELQAAVDDLVQQGRAVPGQLLPLLGLMAVGQILVPTDGVRTQSGEPDPATVAHTLSADFPAGRATATYGRVRTFTPQPGRGGSPMALPDMRRYVVSPLSPGVVRAQAAAGATVLDGDAQGITELAAVHALNPRRALFYAGDLDRQGVLDRVREGASLVFTDSNRHQYIAPSLTTGSTSPVLGPTDPIARGLAHYELFPDTGGADETVAVYSGVRFLRTPQAQSLGLRPEFRPYAAFDGRLSSAWLASFTDAASRYIDLALSKPRAIGTIRVHGHSDLLGGTTAVAISVNGGPEKLQPLKTGWTTVRLDNPRVTTLRLRVATVIFGPGLGGLDEVRVPGLRVHEALRLPTRLAQQTRGADLSHNPISIVLHRTTADFPYQAGNDVEAPQADNPFDAVDPELGIKREVTLPAARSYGLRGWSSVNPAAPDPAIDRLAGVPASWRMASSSRFEGTPINRASSAFDGDPRMAWIGDLLQGRTPWIAVRAPRPFLVRRLRLRPLSPDYGFPSRVDVIADSGFVGEAAVWRDGTIELPTPTRTTSLRLNLVRVRPPTGPHLLRAVAISGVQIPGLRPPHPRRRGRFATGCGALTVTAAGHKATAAVSGTLQQLDAGAPLALRSCGRAPLLPLTAGGTLVTAAPGPVMRPDHIRLSSPPPAGPLPAAVDPRPTAAIVNPGTARDGMRDRVRLRVRAPSWLVLGESYSRGWQAWCGPAGGIERSLGAPVMTDGYANGWPVGRDCQEARFALAPQKLADASYWLSVVGGGVLLLAIAAEVLVRRRRRVDLAPPSVWVPSPPDPVRRLALRGALIAGLVSAPVAGFFFAWRAGAVLGLAVFVLLLLGINARRLIGLAVLALVAIIVAYLAYPSPDAGGFYFPYALHYITLHWVGVGVVCALGCASLLMAWDMRARDAVLLTRGRPFGQRVRAAVDRRIRAGSRRWKEAAGR
jgi:arabinofuranan 3-O-arabinosyltransferase